MNDFTKDELQMIDMDLTTTILKYGKENCSHEYLGLSRKVNEMIHSYCEHELCDIDYDYQPLRCRSCKEVVE